MRGTPRSINHEIHQHLVGYFVLIVGAVLAMWQLGVLDDLTPIWISIGVLVAVGIGIMMAVSSGKSATVGEI